jgi:branched-chain amino acid transport system substrate-binding protein
MTRRLGLLIGVLALGSLLLAAGCEKAPDVVKIGYNIELTGDIPKVGEGSKYAAELLKEEINGKGGLQVGDKKYPLEFIYQDNEAKAESATAAALKLITRDKVLAIIGPQASKQAVPAGEVCNANKTPMISPWSTNPNTTKGRPWVFRACFLDPFQGPVVAKFATEELGAKKAAVLYDIASDYPKGLAEFFKEAFEKIHGPGSVVAFESMNLCGPDCFGSFFTTHYAAAGATGATKEFIDRYKAKYGYVPDDVAALTWDAIRMLLQAVQNAGKLTGNLEANRKAIRDALAKMTGFDGITGKMTFTEGSGDPAKCAVIVKISDKGEFEFYKSVCP